MLGQVLGAYDLGDEDFVIQGKVGVLVVGPNSKQFEAVLMCYLSLLSREMFIRAFFIRSHILSSSLTEIRDVSGPSSKHWSVPCGIGLITSFIVGHAPTDDHDGLRGP